MGSDEMHLGILREVAEEVKPLSITFEKLCQSCEIPIVRKIENISLLLKVGGGKDLRNYRTGSHGTCHDYGADPPGNYEKAHGK